MLTDLSDGRVFDAKVSMRSDGSVQDVATQYVGSRNLFLVPSADDFNSSKIQMLNSNHHVLHPRSNEQILTTYLDNFRSVFRLYFLHLSSMSHIRRRCGFSS